MASSISYIPEPHERAYYEGLFQAADVKRTNNIGGQEAVQFFARSKLPMDVLKNIWTVADQPSTSTLDRSKFAVAIRLIQLTQNGTKGQGANLAVPPGVTLRPAYLEGVSGVTVPLPQQQQQPLPTQASAAVPGGQPAPPQQQMQQAPPTPNSIRSGFSSIPPPSVMSGMTNPSPAAVPPPAAAGPSNALVTQDPYSMSPQEQKRYEDLFPQYAKPDGFVYGPEAVGLFMKSGVNGAVLRELWNMVDRPVDNRLDKLEFAISMHLIVCISKKNLPPPQGQLPPSLRALKNPQQPPPTPSLPPRPPVQQPQQPPPPQQQQQQQQAVAPQAPSLQPAGGMSISDAFEGLSTTPSDMEPATGGPPPLPSGAATGTMQPPAPAVGGIPGLPSYVPAEQQQQQVPAAPAPSMEPLSMAPTMEPHVETLAPVPEVPTPAPVMETPAPAPVQPPSSQDLAKNYQMGDEFQELNKLKDVLQKLQAENISLKAQLGSMTEEEREVQKELGATVAEIGSLSNQLQGLRTEVLDSKTKLLEASAQLKAAREQKGVLNDLIGEATETKVAINDATASLQNVAAANMEQQQMAAQQQQAALQKSSAFEDNLFGFDGGAPAPPVGNSLPPPTQSFDSTAPLQTGMPLSSNSVDISLTNQPPSSPQGQMDFPDIPLDGTNGTMNDARSVDSLPAPSEMSAAPVAFTNEPPTMNPPESEGQQRLEIPAPQQQQQFEQPTPVPSMGIPTPNPAQAYHQMPPPGPAGGLPAAFPTPQPPQQFLQPTPSPLPTPQYGLARPSAVADHNRKESVGGFGSDFVMGGTVLPPGTGVYGAAAAATQAVAPQAAAADNSADIARLEELKSKARSAQETAGDAAAAHIRLAQEAEELRGDADKAEANARSLRAAADEKKKGRFGSGKTKKQLNRDAESAAATATDLRKRFMAVQAQSHDAQAVALQTKSEADKLKEEVEKLELEIASAASMRDQAPEQQSAQGAVPANGYPPAGGYGQPAPYGQPPAGYGAPPAGYGYGQQPPAPPQYSNPYAMPAPGAGEGMAGGDAYPNPF